MKKKPHARNSSNSSPSRTTEMPNVPAYPQPSPRNVSDILQLLLAKAVWMRAILGAFIFADPAQTHPLADRIRDAEEITRELSARLGELVEAAEERTASRARTPVHLPTEGDAR